MMAAFVLGWIGIEFIFSLVSTRIPIIFNIAIGLVCMLIVYTIYN